MISFLFPMNSQKPNYVPTLEDKIEAERQKKVADLKKNGSKGTPVTPESFAVWQEKKRKRKQEEARVSHGSVLELLRRYCVPLANVLFCFLENGGKRDAEEKRWKRFGCFVRTCPL